MVSDSENLRFSKTESTETETETESETVSGESADKPPKRSRFVPPTVEEVRAYCQERGNGIDPILFVDFYEARGWSAGRGKMKDWKAAVRTWERREQGGKEADPYADVV